MKAIFFISALLQLPGSLSFGLEPPRNEVVCQRSDFLDAFPFFHGSPIRFRAQEVAFLMEFSRYMNQKVPEMMRDFVFEKEIYETKASLKRFSIINIRDLFKKKDNKRPPMSPPFPFLPSRPIKKDPVIETLKESSTELEHIKQGLFRAIGTSMEMSSPGGFWESSCKRHWWPFQDDLCSQFRCTACTPAVASAGAACELTGRPKSQKCMQKTMGEGFCNYCIVEFLDK